MITYCRVDPRARQLPLLGILREVLATGPINNDKNFKLSPSQTAEQGNADLPGPRRPRSMDCLVNFTRSNDTVLLAFQNYPSFFFQ
ncbi:hypothetical protein EVAR_20834_1 [Eumeta japonica]|uniref:Uncharacterized protein n=1 Tax=Eumeta variegata TaxID=151549 RepID=A0A4C1UEF3_EUMVA|nr:hypothetical protein EVAR_20834_1 [Eumeta japonica]